VRILISLATAITILAVALVLLLTPIWTHFALDAAGSVTPTGGGQAAIDMSDQTIATLLRGGSFDFLAADGSQMYTADEQAHMRDVRVVLYGFLLLALVGLVFVVASLLRSRRDARLWSAVARGGIWLIVGVVVLGVFAFVAFDTVFTLFHEIFFPGGNWAFPADSNLIRLYPEPFWELSSLALGTISIIGGLIVWFVARRRVAALTTAALATA
jgi:integral membrane protein (TIGR01906 family)